MLEYDGSFLFKVIRVNQQLVSLRRRQEVPQLDTEQRYCVALTSKVKNIFVVNASRTKSLNVLTSNFSGS